MRKALPWIIVGAIAVFAIGVGIGFAFQGGDPDNSLAASELNRKEGLDFEASSEQAEAETVCTELVPADGFQSECNRCIADPEAYEPQGVEEEPQEKDADCDAKGISHEVGNEGTCFFKGSKIIVVNRDHTLNMKELDATLLGIEYTDTVGSSGFRERANDVFVVATLEITNRGHRPAYFDAMGEQVFLQLGEDTYSEDFEAINSPGTKSFLWKSIEIQPQASQVGTVVFDVPKKIASRIQDEGNIQILNFRDADGWGKPKELGVIRTWQ